MRSRDGGLIWVLKDWIHRRVEPLLYRRVLIPEARFRQKKRVQTVRRQGYVRITFIVSSLPMWRFQSLYDLLSEDARFKLSIAIYPFRTYSPREKETAMADLRRHFTEKGIPYLDLSQEKRPGKALRKTLRPDMLFYPQPYDNLFRNDLACWYFRDCLIGYIPYAMLTASGGWAYRSYLNNTAWRLFYPSDARREEAAKVLFNGGANIRISGEVTSDLFSTPPQEEVWKPQERAKKRIIWAPHHAIHAQSWLHRDSFNWLSAFMWEIAAKYRDTVQFAFKPHPRLLTELQEHPDWGVEKAAAYYRQWAEGENTQLETGSYIDLFKESDAMIHDCGSFSVEYHFTEKPVLFTTHDLDLSVAGQNELGRDGILAHYIGATEADIIDFIDNKVLAGNDPRRQERVDFKTKYLTPPGGRSVAENIYQEMVHSIFTGSTP